MGYYQPLSRDESIEIDFGKVFETAEYSELLRSVKTGEMAVGKKTTFSTVDSDHKHTGFYMFVPIYNKNFKIDSEKDRLAAFDGFVYAPFDTCHFMDGILGNRAKDIDLEVYYGEQIDKSTLLYDSIQKHNQNNNISAHTKVGIGDKNLSLKFRAQDSFIFEVTSNKHWYVLAFGLAVSIGTFGLALSLLNTRDRARQMAENMTAELATSQERFMLAVNGSNDGIWDWDIKSNSLFLSPRWKEMLGYEDSELKNEFDTFINLLYEEDKNSIFELLDRYFNGEISRYAVEFRMKRKDGSLCWILARGEAIRDENGKIYRMAGSHTDITQIKNYTLKLEEMVECETTKRLDKEKMLLQQSKMAMMGEMIGAIAHQWRQPLNSLGIMVQEVALDYECGDLTSKSVGEFKDGAMAQIHTMSKTIDDFRNFFSPNKKLEEFFVEDAVLESLQILTSQLKLHNITVIFDDKTNKHQYRCIKNELKQVLLNILANAKDAILEKNLHEAFIKINIEAADKALFISVEDSAGGIPEEIIDKIFDAHFTTKAEGKGTGIGLYMSRQIMEESLLGKITVSNTENGARFVLALPF